MIMHIKHLRPLPKEQEITVNEMYQHHTNRHSVTCHKDKNNSCLCHFPIKRTECPLRQYEKHKIIATEKVNKEKCDLAQKLDITVFIGNTAGIVQFNALWVFDPVVSIIYEKYDPRRSLYYLVLWDLDDLVI
jgi:hypothetical protein